LALYSGARIGMRPLRGAARRAGRRNPRPRRALSEGRGSVATPVDVDPKPGTHQVSQPGTALQTASPTPRAARRDAGEAPASSAATGSSKAASAPVPTGSTPSVSGVADPGGAAAGKAGTKARRTNSADADLSKREGDRRARKRDDGAARPTVGRSDRTDRS